MLRLERERERDWGRGIQTMIDILKREGYIYWRLGAWRERLVVKGLQRDKYYWLAF